MQPLPSPDKTPKRPSKPQSPPSSSPQQLPSPLSPQGCPPSHPTHTKEEPPRHSESKLPVIYRKHQYNNKEFTEIQDLGSGVRTTRSKAPIKYTLSDFNEISEIGPYLVNVSALNPQPSYKKSQWKELSSAGKNCSCSKSECLKKYCCCRQRGDHCTAECSCVNCKNLPRDDSEQEGGRVRSREGREGSRRLQENDVSWTNVCACSRNRNCSKSYCSCKKAGINCSKECQCLHCKN